MFRQVLFGAPHGSPVGYAQNTSREQRNVWGSNYRIYGIRQPSEDLTLAFGLLIGMSCFL